MSLSYLLRHLRVSQYPMSAKVFENSFPLFSRDPEKIFKPLDHGVKGAYDSEVKLDADGKKVKVSLDVQNFTREQIEVKTVGNEIMVVGRKGMKSEDGWTHSHFERRFQLPAGFPPERVECHLVNGRLVLVASRSEPLEQRRVPVQSGDGKSSLNK